MKYALVTGGSRGIGRATCIRMAAASYRILINYKSNESEALKTLEAVRANGSDGELLKFDVSKKDEVDTVLGTWIEQHPDSPIEVLVNNAGIREDALMIWMTEGQ